MRLGQILPSAGLTLTVEQPVSLPGQPDLDPATPEEASGSRAPTLPTLASSAPTLAQQTLVEVMNDLLCLGAAHT